MKGFAWWCQERLHRGDNIWSGPWKIWVGIHIRQTKKWVEKKSILNRMLWAKVWRYKNTRLSLQSSLVSFWMHNMGSMIWKVTRDQSEKVDWVQDWLGQSYAMQRFFRPEGLSSFLLKDFKQKSNMIDNLLELEFVLEWGIKRPDSSLLQLSDEDVTWVWTRAGKRKIVRVQFIVTTWPMSPSLNMCSGLICKWSYLAWSLEV